MSTFGQTFSVLTPAGTDLANNLDTQIQNDKTSINERIQLEHNALNSTATGATTIENAAAQGRHKPGNVSAVYIGTTAECAALTGMYSGALQYDTTLNVLRVYDGSAWTTYQIGDANNIFSGTELLVSIFGTAALAAAGVTTIGSWTTAPTTIANIFDRSSSTTWGNATIATATGYVIQYWNLGAIYKGNIFLLEDINGSAATVYCSCAPMSTIDVPAYRKTTYAQPSTIWSTTASQQAMIMPFYGQYVGIQHSTYPTYSSTFACKRFEVYGSAV